MRNGSPLKVMQSERKPLEKSGKVHGFGKVRKLWYTAVSWKSVIFLGNHADLIPGGNMKSLRFNRMSKIMGIMFVCAALVSAFVSCKNPVNGVSESSLNGTWADSSGGEFIIDMQAKTLVNKYMYNGVENMSYAGNELSVVFTSDNAGYIYIKYTRAANPDWTYSESAPDVGKYYALAFNNLTGSSIKISGAWKEGGQTSCTTLDAAKQEFTVANGYFGTYTVHTKTN